MPTTKELKAKLGPTTSDMEECPHCGEEKERGEQCENCSAARSGDTVSPHRNPAIRAMREGLAIEDLPEWMQDMVTVEGRPDMDTARWPLKTPKETLPVESGHAAPTTEAVQATKSDWCPVCSYNPPKKAASCLKCGRKLR